MPEIVFPGRRQSPGGMSKTPAAGTLPPCPLPDFTAPRLAAELSAGSAARDRHEFQPQPRATSCHGRANAPRSQLLTFGVQLLFCSGSVLMTASVDTTADWGVGQCAPLWIFCRCCSDYRPTMMMMAMVMYVCIAESLPAMV